MGEEGDDGEDDVGERDAEESEEGGGDLVHMASQLMSRVQAGGVAARIGRGQDPAAEDGDDDAEGEDWGELLEEI
jgi:hypothetical protein